VKSRFQADNDLRSSSRTGVLRRESSIDFQSAGAAKLDGVGDLEVPRLPRRKAEFLSLTMRTQCPAISKTFWRVGAGV